MVKLIKEPNGDDIYIYIYMVEIDHPIYSDPEHNVSGRVIHPMKKILKIMFYCVNLINYIKEFKPISRATQFHEIIINGYNQGSEYYDNMIKFMLDFPIFTITFHKKIISNKIFIPFKLLYFVLKNYNLCLKL